MMAAILHLGVRHGVWREGNLIRYNTHRGILVFWRSPANDVAEKG